MSVNLEGLIDIPSALNFKVFNDDPLIPLATIGPHLPSFTTAIFK
jgi:hypothetical protein